MKQSLSAAILVLFSTMTVAAQEQPDYKKLQELFKGGERAFLEGKYSTAAESFEEFLKILPKSKAMNQPRAHGNYYLACAYVKLEKKDEAITSIEKAMEYGFRDFSIIDKDEDLDAIRKAPKFIAAVKKYRALEEEKLQKFNFDLTSVNGTKVAKKKYLGKVLIVDVWGTWCPPCKMEIPHFIALQKKYGSKGLQIVGLNSERTRSKEAAEKLVKQFIKDYEINYPCAIATQEVLSSVPDLRGFPTTLFIGRDGRVRQKIVGYHDYDKLESLVKPLIAEKPPAKKEKKDAPAPKAKASS